MKLVPVPKHDGYFADNKLDNLYLGTSKDNAKDAFKNKKRASGENCSWGKLKERDVLEILSLKGKMKNIDIANVFGVNKCTITDIFKGRTWKHINREEVSK